MTPFQPRLFAGGQKSNLYFRFVDNSAVGGQTLGLRDVRSILHLSKGSLSLLSWIPGKGL